MRPRDKRCEINHNLNLRSAPSALALAAAARESAYSLQSLGPAVKIGDEKRRSVAAIALSMAVMQL
eukprot:3683424-Rhodomonas_salina.2